MITEHAEHLHISIFKVDLTLTAVQYVVCSAAEEGRGDALIRNKRGLSHSQYWPERRGLVDSIKAFTFFSLTNATETGYKQA